MSSTSSFFAVPGMRAKLFNIKMIIKLLHSVGLAKIDHTQEHEEVLVAKVVELFFSGWDNSEINLLTLVVLEVLLPPEQK